jgi:hypothetical protein
MVTASGGSGSKRSRVLPSTLFWSDVMKDVVEVFDQLELL